VGAIFPFSLTAWEDRDLPSWNQLMFLKADQLWRVATVYDTVAADKLSVPNPQRAAFARKAKRLRMLARIAAKIEATSAVKPASELTPRQEKALTSNYFERRQVKYLTLAERLEAARATAASAGPEKKVDLPKTGV
jgi:hypothetical protein